MRKCERLLGVAICAQATVLWSNKPKKKAAIKKGLAEAAELTKRLIAGYKAGLRQYPEGKKPH
jgi:hypothetical protein